MGSFKYDIAKARSATLFILNTLQESQIESGFHSLFKILYFADQFHLAKYARPIIGDKYHAMEYGPVPSQLYDMLKALPTSGSDDYKIDGYNIFALQLPDLDELSDTEIECLNVAIDENKDLTFGQLVDKSHDAAYRKAESNQEITYKNIAETKGANPGMLEYMKELEENSTLFQ